jgi:histidyl-tRNA synthetase
MVPDAESLRVMYEVLRDLKIGKFLIKVRLITLVVKMLTTEVQINHRKLLDGIFAVCGVPEESFRAICSAVDKLDKLAWDEVKLEMVNEKKLAPEIADKVGEYVKLKGGKELVDKLRADAALNAELSANEGLEALNTLFQFLEAYDILSHVSGPHTPILCES